MILYPGNIDIPKVSIIYNSPSQTTSYLRKDSGSLKDPACRISESMASLSPGWAFGSLVNVFKAMVIVQEIFWLYQIVTKEQQF